INPRFQEYLQALARGEIPRKTPHSSWGAALLYQVTGRINKNEGWKELALPILGHHGSLPDVGVAAQYLLDFLAKEPTALQAMKSYIENSAVKLPPMKVSALPPFRRELRIRMLFSALVDADWLDTEHHFSPENAKEREGWVNLTDLWEQFQVNQKDMLAKLKARHEHNTPVNRVRREVYEACLAAATGPQGIYRLTVPTGGGKTRSSLAFALRHALKNKLRRIIVAIPYTSIIDQTAQEYRKIFGDEAVLEHHSQVQVPENDEGQLLAALRFRLATENWDAPLIVTTTVQLFDSLFSNRRSSVRKLHNLAKSVIILDEVQTLPPELLEPTLDVLRSLVEDYGVTLVLSTATQPAFEEARFLRAFEGLEVREMVPEYQKHFERLRRVHYEIGQEPISWEDLAEEVNRYSQVMVVLNTRKDALALLNELGSDSVTFHLSTLLCGAHRRIILDEVKRRLAIGEPVRLISTQVVEAGVDIDFPVVYRAFGPLDRIVQAAGRCNREGKPAAGKVRVFEPLEGRFIRNLRTWEQECGHGLPSAGIKTG
ncbi:MAG TPA: CRISPR-associated helicase Cas3', partial [Candidatus Acetothermia bacterium]|nr:CRISPR-associated helicase Cas3' [Candidatus Acetothermia bacterium]